MIATDKALVFGKTETHFKRIVREKMMDLGYTLHYSRIFARQLLRVVKEKP